MQSDQRFAKYSIIVVAISAIAAGFGTLSAALGAPAGAIVLGEVSGFACFVAFTMLIWAAIQDGKHSERAAETIVSAASS
jgi:O-antigen/teichoic acid export membrane protein